MVDIEAANLLGVGGPSSLWHMLTRPEPLSPARLRALCCLAITLKLDGRRAALLFADCPRGEILEVTSTGIRRLRQGGTSTGGEFSLLDCEHFGETYHVFDALIVAGQDIRHLPLYERVQLASKTIGTCPALTNTQIRVVAKPYLFLGSEFQTPRKLAEHALQQMGPHTDGLILLNAADPYWVPPLKFKQSITTDFLLQEAKNGDGFVFLSKSARRTYEILRDKTGAIVRIRTAPKAVAEAFSKQHYRNGVVVECAHTRTGGARVKRLRTDRQEPNRTQIARENAELQDLGCHRRSWLLKAMSSPLDAIACHWKYCEALFRSLTVHADDVTNGQDQQRIMIMVAENSYPDGFLERALLEKHFRHAEILDVTSNDSLRRRTMMSSEFLPKAVLLPFSVKQACRDKMSLSYVLNLVRDASFIGGLCTKACRHHVQKLAEETGKQFCECSENDDGDLVSAAYGCVGLMTQSIRPFVLCQE